MRSWRQPKSADGSKKAVAAVRSRKFRYYPHFYTGINHFTFLFFGVCQFSLFDAMQLKFFMKLDRIRGPVRGTAYDGWFQIYNFQFGTGKGISSARRVKLTKKEIAEGKTLPEKQYRESSSPSYSEITISKAIDGFSAVILHEIPIHVCHEKVIIEAVDMDGYVVSRWYEHDLCLNLISAYQHIHFRSTNAFFISSLKDDFRCFVLKSLSKYR